MKDATIGIIVPTNLDFCRNIIMGVRKWCFQNNADLNIISEKGNMVDLNRVRTDLFSQFMGIIAHISAQEELDLIKVHCPIVVGTSNSSDLFTFPRIINDEEQIGKMGAEYLLSRGFRNFVFLNRERMAYSRDRRLGFSQIIKSSGAELHLFDFRKSQELNDISVRVKALNSPVGLMTDSDLTARMFIECFPDHRIWFPHRIAVLGVDDDSFQNALSPISLSSIRINGHRLGYEAADLIKRLHNGEKPPPSAVLIKPIRVIERASTNVQAISDPIVSKAVKILRDRISDIHSVSDLVNLIGIQRRTLEKRFRKAFNRSIAHEITSARIEYARQLLESTDLTINEIAELVGYPEYRLLTLAFQRMTGEPPSTYRKRVKFYEND